MRILAIDGSLNCSGWVFLDDRGGENWEGVKASKYGVIRTKPTMSLGFKLYHIRKELIRLIDSLRPGIVVLEETYSGSNKLTTARLNNAKGVIVSVVYEKIGRDPELVTVAKARSCLGFKSKKNAEGKRDPKLEPFEFFKEKYNLPESYRQGNDITDAFTIGWAYILSRRGNCQKPRKSVTKSKMRPTRRNIKVKEK
jgi:Holliday junction resolvasome RuvABC endonuclease subunit